jgi:hypothetical protein
MSANTQWYNIGNAVFTTAPAVVDDAVALDGVANHDRGRAPRHDPRLHESIPAVETLTLTPRILCGRVAYGYGNGR